MVKRHLSFKWHLNPYRVLGWPGQLSVIPAGAMRSHLSEFKKHRAARIDHYVVEVNKLIIRLEKVNLVLLNIPTFYMFPRLKKKYISVWSVPIYLGIHFIKDTKQWHFLHITLRTAHDLILCRGYNFWIYAPFSSWRCYFHMLQEPSVLLFHFLSVLLY